MWCVFIAEVERVIRAAAVDDLEAHDDQDAYEDNADEDEVDEAVPPRGLLPSMRAASSAYLKRIAAFSCRAARSRPSPHWLLLLLLFFCKLSRSRLVGHRVAGSWWRCGYPSQILLCGPRVGYRLPLEADGPRMSVKAQAGQRLSEAASSPTDTVRCPGLPG